MKRCSVMSTLCVMLCCSCASQQKPESGIDTRPNGTSTGTTDSGRKGDANLRVDDAIAAACGLRAPRFGFDSSTVAASAELDGLAQCFISGPLKNRQIRLVGHADPRGETEYNLGLGHRRAGAIERYLVDRGMARARIATSSRGDIEAVGTDESGWAADRRVDMLLAH